jgi:glycine reductase complex component B subunit gamma
LAKKKIVHYLNQFFAGIGGEEKANIEPEIREGVIGPGMALNAALGDEAEIVATVICGDSFFNENPETSKQRILEMIKPYEPDLFLAGPAFNAGRYGVACATVAWLVQEELKIPVLTGMYIENPGADLFRKGIYIVETGNSAASMKAAVPHMVSMAKKLLHGETIGLPADENYIPRGIRKNVFREERGSRRAVNMLISKLKEEPYETEYAMPSFDRVPPAAAVKELSHSVIALVSSGGIVPTGNPDRIESSSASKYGRYSIEGIEDMTAEDYVTAHGGYDPSYANEDPDRVIPLDVMRDMEREGIIGSIYEYLYTTVGNGTSVGNSRVFGMKIGRELKEAGVDAVMLTST